jgi:hypothetical protein
MMRRLVFVMWTLLPGARAEAAALPRNWIGADRSELVAVLGQPQEVRSDGQGRQHSRQCILRTLGETLDAPELVDKAPEEALHLGANLYFLDASRKIYGKLDALNP